MARKSEKKRIGIITIAIIASVLIYITGVMSGMYANKILKNQTDTDINALKAKTENDILQLRQLTEQDMQNMKDYVNFLDSNLRSMQLERIYMDTLNSSESCNFSRDSMNELVIQLSYYWDKLPFRIEQYERDNAGRLPNDYLLLKKEYTQLSVRTWLLAKNQYQKCDAKLLNVLYFYSADCAVCAKQGEQLDVLKGLATGNGQEIMVFTVDYNTDDMLVKYLKDYYHINSTPAVIVNDNVYQGRLFKSWELMPNEKK